jgi:hypothetical protein
MGPGQPGLGDEGAEEGAEIFGQVKLFPITVQVGQVQQNR